MEINFQLKTIMKYKNILQIDDDSDDCSFFLEALEEVSCASYTAIHNPVLALQQLSNCEIRPDLIFLDINMPVMNGMELLTEMKKKKLIIPVIIFSTSIPTDIENKLQGLGAIGYYNKPNDFGTMKTILRNFT